MITKLSTPTALASTFTASAGNSSISEPSCSAANINNSEEVPKEALLWQVSNSMATMSKINENVIENYKIRIRLFKYILLTFYITY